MQGKYLLFTYNIGSYRHLPFIVGKLFYAGWVACEANIFAKKEMEEAEDWETISTAEQLARIDNKRDSIVHGRQATLNKFPFNTTTEVCNNISELLFRDIAAMYPMQIVGAWTAFEVLAGDLWIHAVNRKPGRLAGLSGLSNAVSELARGRTIKFNKSQKAEGGDAPGKSIKVELIGQVTNQSFDLSNRMGTFLSEAKRASFTSLSEIRRAYSSAFATEEEYDNARPLLVALADERLDVLTLMRNLLVHRAGDADDVYIKESSKIASAPKIDPGNKMFLNGEITRKQVESAVSCAMSLVQGMDQWMTTTPKV